MVEAAVRGVVDFSQAKFFDPAWRRRVKCLLDGLQNVMYREELRLSQDYYLGLLHVAAQGTPDLLRELFEGLHAARDALAVAYRPWQTTESREAQRQAAGKKYQETWEQHFGKMDDPETRA